MDASKTERPLEWRMSLVHKNPSEGETPTKYSDPSVIAELGFNIMTINNGRPPHCAITWDDFDSDIFPQGSDGREWVENLAENIDAHISAIHDQGLKAMYWFDMFVLPQTLVEKYGDQIVDSDGQWSFDSESMNKIVLYMLDAVFKRFPTLDGLLIRTGEIYTEDVPFHAGASPITQGYRSHIQLLDLLRQVVIDKYDKMIFYRTWSFDGFTSDPEYYLNVTNAVDPHPNLYFVIKHTKLDFWRTVDFNPTLNIGQHPFLVEVQCQREYEGKGAFPNYVMNGVIEGFEEYANDPKPRGLNDIRNSDRFRGIVAWPRGGGWRGPYPADEFWIDMNVKSLILWAQNTHLSEYEAFGQYAKSLSSKLSSPHQVENFTKALREVALLSARGTLLGHYSLVYQLADDDLVWTRDWYIGGGDDLLKDDFEGIIAQGVVGDVLDEKKKAVQIWGEIADITHNKLTPALSHKQHHLADFLGLSTLYGQFLYTVFEQSWIVSLKGMAGNISGDYDLVTIRNGIQGYDRAWARYADLANRNESQAVSSLYTPWAWGGTTGPSNTTGAKHSVDMWRSLVDASGRDA